MTNQYKGECLCGVCRYVVMGDEPKAMYLCHCSRCRKETGTIHAATVFFNNAQLEWEKGKDHITHFKLENTRKQRAFCNICGGPLPWKSHERRVTLPAGTLDDDTVLTPTAHIFHQSRSSWEDKIIGLKRFDELP